MSEIDPKWRDYEGLIICGTHTPENPEYLISKITEAYEKKIPFLGICFGHQLCAIEWARRNGTPDATSEEWGTGTNVVRKRSEKKVGLHEGESWWSDYEIAIQWEKPPWFITTPYHPEYQSYVTKPHKDLIDFLNLCKRN